MLKLKRIQALGFKSFCDRTEVSLAGEGIAAIVGPNGCGKSNISDAITWVLGEQSAKSLRGAKMEDVIFAGTLGRKPTGMAEVSLTLVDPDVYDGADTGGDGPELVVSGGDRHHTSGLPEDWSEDDLRQQQASETAAAVSDLQPGTPLDGVAAPSKTENELSSPSEAGDETTGTGGDVVLRVRRRHFARGPVRAGEITVTRRLFRTGESEYLLNGRLCRLRDIQDIFLGTGLGGESYAMIGQERIGQMLSSKPLDRRSIIEEAAGITRFKTKKRLAELRLEAAQQNLSRVNDIFEEVARQIGSLKRQASKAERYGALRAELREKLSVALASRLRLLEAEQEQTAAEIARITDSIHLHAEEVRAQDARHSAAVQRSYDVRKVSQETSERGHQCAVELERIAARVTRNLERCSELATRLDAAAGEVELARTQEAELASEAEQHRSFLASASAETAAAKEVAALQLNQAQQAAHRVAQSEATAEAARREVVSLLQLAAQARNERVQAEESLSALDREHDRLTLESDVARGELASLGVQRGQVQLSFEGVTDRLQRLEAEIASLRLDLEAKRGAEADSRRRGDTLRRELAAMHGKRSSLEGLIQERSYSTDAVRELLQSVRKSALNNGESLKLTTLADLLEVEGPHSRAIDELLRDELNYIVVPDLAAANRCMNLVRSEIAGRVTLLLLPQHADTDQDQGAGPATELPDGNDLPRVLDSVRLPPDQAEKLRRSLPKLTDGYLAADSAEARTWAERYPAAWFVTPDGEVFHQDTITGGQAAAGGPLALKRELREVIKRVQALESDAAECETATISLVRDIASLVSAMDSRAAERRDAEREVANSGASLRQMVSEAERMERRLGDWQLASERNRDQRNRKQDLVSKLSDDAQHLDQDRETKEGSLLALQAEVTGLRAQREKMQLAASSSAALLAALEERQRNARGSAQQTERVLLAHSQRLSQLIEQIAAASAERQARVDETVGLENLRAELEARKQALGAESAELATESDRLRREIDALDQHLRTERDALEDLRRQQSDLAVRSARLASDREHVEGTCRNDLGVAPENLLSDDNLLSLVGEELVTREAECVALRQRLEAMGPVNMMALEEFTEASGRHDFLQTQRDDLLSSISNIQTSIREIDDVSRAKFDQAFTAINANFATAFAKLFGGGEATMKLTDGENAAESGIDIVAAPPGKKAQNILLLSGGEKALTALGLLVGIFQFQPAPFCVLDEVDAPLDEVNVGRFTRLLSEMSATTQFIVITHSKRTMQQADVIYGVTMQEPGVSKVVSVRLGERRVEQDRRRAVA